MSLTVLVHPKVSHALMLKWLKNKSLSSPLMIHSFKQVLILLLDFTSGNFRN
uniref:Uncharacterized protein n=1 Tax=Rhizophora mucronata TaxID=61149 RepID=A0A2P2NV07_RHIMU